MIRVFLLGSAAVLLAACANAPKTAEQPPPPEQAVMIAELRAAGFAVAGSACVFSDSMGKDDPVAIADSRAAWANTLGAIKARAEAGKVPLRGAALMSLCSDIDPPAEHSTKPARNQGPETRKTFPIYIDEKALGSAPLREAMVALIRNEHSVVKNTRRSGYVSDLESPALAAPVLAALQARFPGRFLMLTTISGDESTSGKKFLQYTGFTLGALISGLAGANNGPDPPETSSLLVRTTVIDHRSKRIVWVGARYLERSSPNKPQTYDDQWARSLLSPLLD